MTRTIDERVEARGRGAGVAAARAGCGPSARMALAVADVNWFSTEHLFRSIIDPSVKTLLLHCQDYRNAWAQRSSGGLRAANRTVPVGVQQWMRRAVLPPGWMKRYPRWGMRPLVRAVRGWKQQHAADAGLSLVMTYPYYLSLADRLRPERLVYFNLDDYAYYWPGCADDVRRIEREAVRASDLTVCVSRSRCLELRAAVPEMADRIRHLPHGAPEVAIARQPLVCPAPAPPELAGLPRPLLGYFGSLEDRIDWELLDRLAGRLPGASLVLIGRLPEPGHRGAACDACLARPNVHTLGWRTQAQMLAYTGAFDVCLIPYRPDHPFNRACCPTKIMDYMGTGRPIVSTALPECLLHAERMVVAGSNEEFVAAVESLAAERGPDLQAASRHAYAQAHRCGQVVRQLLDWIDAIDPD